MREAAYSSAFEFSLILEQFAFLDNGRNYSSLSVVQIIVVQYLYHTVSIAIGS